MKNLISKKLALLAIVLFASIGHAFGANISVTTNNDDFVDWRLVWPENEHWASGTNEFYVTDGVDASMDITWIHPYYTITEVTVDDSPVNVATFRSEGYTWSNIQGNHTVNITLEALPTNEIFVDFNYENVASANFSYNNGSNGMVVRYNGGCEIPSGIDVDMTVNSLTSAYQLNKVLVDDVDVTNQIINGKYVFSNLSADHHVKVFLDKVENTNSISVSFIGTISASYYFYENGKTWWTPENAEFTPGNDVELHIDTSTGYKVTSMSITNTSTNVKTDVTDFYQEHGFYKFSDLSADYAVEVEVGVANIYKVSVDYDSSKGTGYIISYKTDPNNGTGFDFYPNGNEFNEGSNVRLCLYPYNGYSLESILVDGVDVTSTYLENNYFDFMNINDNHTVVVQFKESVPVNISYTFNREDVAGVFVSWNYGSTTISRTSSITVMEGSDVRMTNNWLDESYRIKSFKVDGIDYTETFINEGYSLFNVTSDHAVDIQLETIEPSFAIDVSFNHDNLGEICLSGYSSGRCVRSSQTVDLTAGENIWVSGNSYSSVHPIKSITIDGIDVTNNFMQQGGYSIPSISSNHSIYVEYDELEYNTISVILQEGDAEIFFEDGNYTTWTQEMQIAKGHNAKMFITPTAGYAISNVSISDGSSTQDITDTFNANGGYYEFTSLNSNYTVTVSFTRVDTRTITLSFDNEKGSVYINGRWVGPYELTYNQGSIIRLTTNPYGGYKVGSIFVGEEDVTDVYNTNGYYEFELNSNSAITVNFVKATYYNVSITCDNPENGYYSLNQEGEVIEGADIHLYVDPSTGYVPIVTDNGTEVVLTQEDGSYYYTINNLDADHTINVAFENIGTSRIYLSINENETKIVYLSNNSRTGSGYFTLTTGTTARLVVYPQFGYELESITIDGVDIIESYLQNGYYDLEVSECTITVTMKKKDAPETVPFTLSDLGIGTFCYEFDLDFSNVRGIKAYVASGFNPISKQLVLTRVDEVPAGTGILIKGSSGDYQIPTNDTYFRYANMLKGIVETTYIAENSWEEEWNGYGLYAHYLLGDDGEFYRTNGEELPANSAYLTIPTKYVDSSSLAKIGLIFLDDEEEVGGITTGVGYIWAGEKRTVTTDAIYNLQGQKVTEKSLKPGIYIKNGKKFMVK